MSKLPSAFKKHIYKDEVICKNINNLMLSEKISMKNYNNYVLKFYVLKKGIH